VKYHSQGENIPAKETEKRHEEMKQNEEERTDELKKGDSCEGRVVFGPKQNKIKPPDVCM
jgi:hypothetical protein